MRPLVVFLVLVATATSARAATTVTDADTLILNDTVFRLEGIEGPRTDQVCLDDAGVKWSCGIEARDRLKEWIGNRAMRCDDKGPDRIFKKRRMGICWVEGETTSLNQWLVREGWALNLEPYAKSRFKADQEQARDNRKGVWKGCFVSPEALRRWTISTTKLLGAACPKANSWPVREMLFPDFPAMPTGCPIKGRVAMRAQIAGHQGIYHLESCGSYGRTKNPHRWFCSEEEAQAEGFRKSYTCEVGR
jgi:endonuclease YncB( thermonuclease family)